MILKDLVWSRLYELPGYIYAIYLSADSECQLEELVFDLAMFCDKHNCSTKKIIENDTTAMF